MKRILPSLTGVMLCATTLHSAAADSTVPLDAYRPPLRSMTTTRAWPKRWNSRVTSGAEPVRSEEKMAESADRWLRNTSIGGAFFEQPAEMASSFPSG